MVNVVATPTPQGGGAELLGFPMQQSDTADVPAFSEALSAILGNGVQGKANGIGVEIPIQGSGPITTDKPGQSKDQGEQAKDAAMAGAVVVAVVMPQFEGVAVPVQFAPETGESIANVSADVYARTMDSLAGRGVRITPLPAAEEAPVVEIPEAAVDAQAPIQTTGVGAVDLTEAASATISAEMADSSPVVQTPEGEEAIQVALQSAGPVGASSVESGNANPAARSVEARNISAPDLLADTRPSAERPSETIESAKPQAQPSARETGGGADVVDPTAPGVRSTEVGARSEMVGSVTAQVQKSMASPMTDSEAGHDWGQQDRAPEVVRVDASAATPSDTRGAFQVVADRAAETGSVTRPELHTRVIDQVVKEVRLQKLDGQSNVVVKLNPPELGSLRLQISQDSAGLTSHIQATTEHVGRLLQAHVPALVDALSEAGVKLESVTISTAPSFGALAQDLTQSNAQNQQYQGRRANQRNLSTGTGFVPVQGMSANVSQAGYSWLA